MKVILADLVEELAAADAKPLGGLGAVSPAGHQGALDRPALHLGQQGAERKGLNGVAGRGHCQVERLRGVEVLGQDGPAPRGDHRPCQGVLQLPNVSRPGSFPDCREGLGGKRKLAPAVPPLHALEDVVRQGRDVLGAVAEGRDDDPGDVEAVEQVLAEPAGRDLFGQVAVRGRDDAGIGAESLGPPDALELPLLE